jgi:hypothetical protein
MSAFSRRVRTRVVALRLNDLELLALERVARAAGQPVAVALRNLIWREAQRHGASPDDPCGIGLLDELGRLRVRRP